MNSKNMFKKAQSLPLNTIVIAILVVIVLLVIILFFTGTFSEESDKVDSVKGCTLDNPIISTAGYIDAQYKAADSCLDKANGWSRLSIVPTREKGDVTEVCCVKEKVE